MPKKLLDIPKYKEVVRYLIQRLGKVSGKKKMYKLLYFVDFDYFEAYETSLTGETYKKLQMGPAPVYFESLLSEMPEIIIEEKKMMPHHNYDTCIYSVDSNSMMTDYSLDENEIKMLDRIIKKYGHLTGKQLEDLSHSEAPWNAVAMYEIIPYEYSYYRDTPDLVN